MLKALTTYALRALAAPALGCGARLEAAADGPQPPVPPCLGGGGARIAALHHPLLGFG